MPSPFPGMNPYFETRGRWRGFHNSFLYCLRAAIADAVAPRYFVDIEESLFLERDGERGPLFAVANLSVARPPRPPAGLVGGGVLVASDAVAGTLPRSRPVRRSRRWLEVYDTRSRKVVTVIEVLSPSDKRPGKDRDKYLDKRDRLFRTDTHLVEIDLLRGGLRVPTRGLPACDYFCAVSRHPGRPRAVFYPFDLAQPLPVLPLPLLPGDPEPAIPLKPVIDRVHDEGHYADHLYTETPEPPLTPEQAAWAATFLPPEAARGRPMTTFPDPAARSPEEAAMLAGVLADLPNDLPKLVYADWLDDHGDARGAKLRAGVAAVRTGKPPKISRTPAGWEHLTGLALAADCYRHGLADLYPRLLPLARPAVGFHGKRSSDGRIPVGASKFCGEPDLPPDVGWPVGARLPMIFHVQIDLSDLVCSQAAQELPAAGLLSAFTSIDGCAPGAAGSKRNRLLFTPPDRPLVRRPFSTRHAAEFRYSAARLEFRERLSVPCLPALRPADRRAVGDRESGYYRTTEDAGHYLLGHTDTGSNRTGWKTRRHLIDFDPDTAAGWDGAEFECPFWTVTAADLTAGRLDRNRYEWYF